MVPFLSWTLPPPPPPTPVSEKLDPPQRWTDPFGAVSSYPASTDTVIFHNS